MKTTGSLLAMVLFCALLLRAQDQLSIGVLAGSNLRGVSAVTDRIVWVSGSKGTIARTTDAGTTWQRMTPPQGAEDFDFRDVEAFSADTAFVMSAGPGEQSRIWKTNDGGKSWRQQYANPSPEFFLDSLACWRDIQAGKQQQCVALSDPVAGKFLVLLTDDGEHWRELPRDHMPPALTEKRTGKDGKQEDLKEGAFAASGTAITVLGNNIWFGTGGPKARVFHSADRGQTWTVSDTPIMHGEPSQGIFSIAFRDTKHGVIVGGDYKQPAKTGANIAFTSNGGKSWTLADATRTSSRDSNDLPYCSAVAYSKTPDRIDAAGLQGLYHIIGEGKSAQVGRTGETRPFNAMSSNWLVGPSGSVLLRVEPPAPSLKRPGK
jgi:photosystem II stability/assembly factor-like uncharacterized protein